MDNAFNSAEVYQGVPGALLQLVKQSYGVYKHLMTGVSHMLPGGCGRIVYRALFCLRYPGLQ